MDGRTIETLVLLVSRNGLSLTERGKSDPTGTYSCDAVSCQSLVPLDYIIYGQTHQFDVVRDFFSDGSESLSRVRLG